MPCAHLRAAAVLQLVHHWLMLEPVQNFRGRVVYSPGSCAPSTVRSQTPALLREPVLTDLCAPLLELVPLLGVALHDIGDTMSAESHHIIQLLAPPCLPHSSPQDRGGAMRGALRGAMRGASQDAMRGAMSQTPCVSRLAIMSRAADHNVPIIQA